MGFFEKFTLGEAIVFPSMMIEALYSVEASPSLRVNIITELLPDVSISAWIEKGRASTA